jgi:multidrug resistance efflux pump
MDFEHTRRTLAAMNLRTTAALLLFASLTFGGWMAWLLAGHVVVYVRSTSARLEMEPPPTPLNTAVDGVVSECHLTLGASVTEGEPLVRLDARAFELQADEERATLRSNEASVDALDQQLQAEQLARDAMLRVVSTTERAAAAKVAAGLATSELSRQQNEVISKLAKAELASKIDSLRSQSEAEAQRLQARVSSRQAALDTSTANMTLQDRLIRVSALSTSIVQAQNAVAESEAHLRTLENEVVRRVLRARTAGILADVVSCTPGMTVTSTTRLGTLLPAGEVRVVAFFEPGDAVGRVQPGQTAVVRVDNFPWTQYGTLQAVVRELGSEPRDGLVRAELAVSSINPQIPAIHGLIGSVEVATERISPARLLLRMAGQVLTTTQPPPTRTPTATSAAAAATH